MSSFVELLDLDGLPVVSSFEPYFFRLRLSDDSLILTLELSCNYVSKNVLVMIIWTQFYLLKKKYNIRFYARAHVCVMNIFISKILYSIISFIFI